MKYLVAEKFRSIQGEGVYAGTPMAFIRFVGCSVGKKICSACDTDFEEPVPWRGGGEFSDIQLLDWVANYEHICLTGGEPFDRDLEELIRIFRSRGPRKIHIESSGTKPIPEYALDSLGYTEPWVWLCVSPKPGFLEAAITSADEVKVIMPGLGVLKHGNALPAKRVTDVSPMGENVRGFEVHEQEFPWPTLEDALRWARMGKTVFIQPRNHRAEVDYNNLRLCQDIVAEHPELRLSVQLHKILRVQ